MLRETLSQEDSAPTTRQGGRLQSFPTRMPIAVELVAEILGRVMARSAIRSREGSRVEMSKDWVKSEKSREEEEEEEEEGGVGWGPGGVEKLME